LIKVYKRRIIVVDILIIFLSIFNIFVILTPYAKKISSPVKLTVAKENLLNIRTALESYYNEHHNYPNYAINSLDDFLIIISPYLEREELLEFEKFSYQKRDSNYLIKVSIKNHQFELTREGIKEYSGK
jgi:hypothetical protein